MMSAAPSGVIKQTRLSPGLFLHPFYSFDTRIQTQLQRFCGQQCQLQAAVARLFAFGAQDRAVLVEAGEQASQIVQIRAHDVRRAFTRDDGQGFFKLQQTGRQLGFTVFGDLTGAAASVLSSISALRNTESTRV